MSFYTNYIKNKNLYIKINQTGGTVCGCGCETSNILSLSQASVPVESEYCGCNGHTHGNYFFKGELTNLFNEPALIGYMADFHTPYNIIETKVLRNMGLQPIFKNEMYCSRLPEWYSPEELIDVPYFLPSKDKSILTVCIPINTVDLHDVDLVWLVQDWACSICGGEVRDLNSIYGGDYDSYCECGLPDTMAVVEIKIENLRNQDENYSYMNFHTLIENICDTLESVSRDIPNNMKYKIENIVSFFRLHYNIEMINDYLDGDD